jgi:hypothetical protein
MWDTKFHTHTKQQMKTCTRNKAHFLALEHWLCFKNAVISKIGLLFRVSELSKPMVQGWQAVHLHRHLLATVTATDRSYSHVDTLFKSQELCSTLYLRLF